MIKEKCTNCIHEKVCNIYEFAKKYNEENNVNFNSADMADVCRQYKTGKTIAKIIDVINNE